MAREVYMAVSPGYDAPLFNTGDVDCPFCGVPITPGRIGDVYIYTAYAKDGQYLQYVICAECRGMFGVNDNPDGKPFTTKLKDGNIYTCEACKSTDRLNIVDVNHTTGQVTCRCGACGNYTLLPKGNRID